MIYILRVSWAMVALMIAGCVEVTTLASGSPVDYLVMRLIAIFLSLLAIWLLYRPLRNGSPGILAVSLVLALFCLIIFADAVLRIIL